MNQSIIVLSVAQYQIKNDQTGATEAEGCTVRYLMADDLQHTEDAVRSVKGRVPAKTTIAYGDYAKFQTVPGLYAVSLDYNVDSKGKAAIVPKDFQFLGAISINKSGGVSGGKATAAGFPK